MVVLISGNGSNLQAIIDYLKQHPDVNANISAVISNRPDAFGLTRAQQANIPTKVIDHKTFASREAFDAELISTIDSLHCDLLVFAGFMRILTPAFINHYLGRMINIHPSLLPKFQGVNTHERAIAAGEKEHGCSVHFVTLELDSGPIIMQGVVPIEPSDTPLTLKERVHLMEHLIYPQAIALFAQQRLSMRGNHALLDGTPLPPQGQQSHLSEKSL
jgi:phosphoribosylglycinamide formyltransferase-1